MQPSVLQSTFPLNREIAKFLTVPISAIYCKTNEKIMIERDKQDEVCIPNIYSKECRKFLAWNQRQVQREGHTHPIELAIEKRQQPQGFIEWLI